MGKIDIVDYKAEHMLALQHTTGHSFIGTTMTAEEAVALEKARHSYTGLLDGKPVFCAGVSEYWPGRGEAWAYMPAHTGKVMLQITRIVKRFFEVCDVQRLEAPVYLDFEAGIRWVKMLGFELETPLMRKYAPGGHDCAMYVKVK